MRAIKLRRKSQADVITTTLLILVGISAVIVLSYFVIKMVNEKLTDRSCLDIISQLKISPEETYFNNSETMLYVQVERESKSFNLTGIRFNYGDELLKSSVVLNEGAHFKWLWIYNRSYMWENTALINDNGNIYPAKEGNFTSSGVHLPNQGEAVTFRVNSSGREPPLSRINTLEITPIINGKECDKKIDSLTVRQI